MNHHGVIFATPAPDSARQSLVQSVAAAVRELVHKAESGAGQDEMFRAGAEAGEECARMALTAGDDNEPAEVVAILRRLLRKEARRRWELGGEYDHDGDGAAALHYRKVSVLLDAGADALGSQSAMSAPGIATGTRPQRASPAAFSVGKPAFSC